MQLDALREAGCEKVFAEKKSGTSTSGRDALAEALDCVQDSSDTLVVTRLDRSARSAGDLHAIVAKLSANLPVRLQASDAVWQSLFFLFAPLAVVLFAIQLNRDDLLHTLLIVILLGSISGILSVLQLAGNVNRPLYL